MRKLLNRIRRKSQTTSTSPQLGPFLSDPGPSLPQVTASVTQTSGPSASNQTYDDDHVNFGGCPTCRDLDPNEAPETRRGTSEESWARKEYDIDPWTPAGDLKITNAHSILDTAAQGCIYCIVLRMVLDQIRPGWEREDCFLYLFVAQGFPVVMRLLFGKTTQIDGVLPDDYALPSERRVNVKLDLVERAKPGIEVEIYRYIGAPLPQSKKPEIQEVMDLLTDRIGPALDRCPTSDHDLIYDMINGYINGCNDLHKACNPDPHPSLLPDRIVWLKAPKGTLQLIEPQNLRANYVALSYCWGYHGDDIFRTDMKTLQRFKDRISFNELPALFRDVVAICRKINIDYLWIDRLCIIQGSNGDFDVQAPKMASIFGNAYLTIAAASARDENDRILGPRGPIWSTYYLNLSIGHGYKDKFPIHYRRRPIQVGKEDIGGDFGKVSTRAWIWQERLLSRRSVWYTPGALKFECRCTSYWEGFMPDLRGHSWSNRLNSNDPMAWTRLVEEFTAKDITYARDRLPAIKAVMERVAARTKWTPIYGLWKENLCETLAWRTNRDIVGGRAMSIPDSSAPTWSWTSVDGPISFSNVRSFQDSRHAASLFRYHLELTDVLRGGDVILAGRLLSRTIRMRLETAKKKGSLPRPLYEINDHEDATKWHNLNSADTVLRKFSAHLENGATLYGSQRVYAGEPPPEEPWTSLCYLLLLASGHARCECLVLGLSERKFNYFERLGMIGNLPLSMFKDVGIQQLAVC